MTNFPELTKRRALFPTEGGERVNLSALHSSFAAWERVCWYRNTVHLEYDKFGTLPDDVEVFLMQLSLMANAS